MALIDRLSRYTPQAVTLRRVAYTGILITLLLLALINLGKGHGQGWGAVDWAVFGTFSLVLGFSYACFGWALLSTGDCLFHALGDGAKSHAGPWPRPIGTAAFTWVGHLALLGLAKALLAVGGSSAHVFPGPWYFGFLPHLF